MASFFENDRINTISQEALTERLLDPLDQREQDNVTENVLNGLETTPQKTASDRELARKAQVPDAVVVPPDCVT